MALTEDQRNEVQRIMYEELPWFLGGDQEARGTSQKSCLARYALCSRTFGFGSMVLEAGVSSGSCTKNHLGRGNATT